MSSSSNQFEPAPSLVSLVIPGRNVSATVRECLDSIVPLLGHDGLYEVIFVDDGSTDDTPRIVQEYGDVTYLRIDAQGRGAARNVGWSQATCPLVWFVDADCVVEPDALKRLRKCLARPSERHVAAVGGSYLNRYPESLVASLIHEEIVARHARMPRRVSFLATFNVLYRKQVLEQTGGFSDLPRGQDAELAYRVTQDGYKLHFEPRSLVAHHHQTRLLPYLQAQYQHGVCRVELHRRHPAKATGDSYSNLVDHLQPPLAMLSLATLPFSGMTAGYLGLVASLLLLVSLQLPMAWRLVRRTRQAGLLAYVGFGLIRSYYRGFGLCVGLAQALLRREAVASSRAGQHASSPADRKQAA